MKVSSRLTASLLKTIICLALVQTVSGSPASAQTPAPLQLIQKRDIKFGTYASDIAAPGTVILSPNSDTTSTTGAVFDFGGVVKRARFQILGEPKSYVIVTLPTSITIRKGTSSHTMVVDTFTMDNTNPIRLNKNGKRTINIGATLHVGINQRKGNYKRDNEFVVYVDYQ